jgi:hypothetical protein
MIASTIGIILLHVRSLGGAATLITPIAAEGWCWHARPYLHASRCRPSPSQGLQPEALCAQRHFPRGGGRDPGPPAQDLHRVPGALLHRGCAPSPCSLLLIGVEFVRPDGYLLCAAAILPTPRGSGRVVAAAWGTHPLVGCDVACPQPCR